MHDKRAILSALALRPNAYKKMKNSNEDSRKLKSNLNFRPSKEVANILQSVLDSGDQMAPFINGCIEAVGAEVLKARAKELRAIANRLSVSSSNMRPNTNEEEAPANSSSSGKKPKNSSKQLGRDSLVKNEL